MLIQNLHTHTPRCHHATGTEREYIESAIRAGIRELGFSDHAPMLFPDPGYYSTMRMYPEELEGYVTTLQALRREYKDNITLYIGLEVEYYPDLFRNFLRFISDYPIEYLILGQHYLGNEMGSPYAGRESSDISGLKQYVSQACEGMRTGKFIYLAHPDLYYFTGSREIYYEEMAKICKTALELDFPLELNVNGAQQMRHYPTDCFWEIAGEYGNKVLIGSDAHCPEMLNQPEAEQRCRDIAARYHLPVLDRLELHSPCIE